MGFLGLDFSFFRRRKKEGISPEEVYRKLFDDKVRKNIEDTQKEFREGSWIIGAEQEFYSDYYAQKAKQKAEEYRKKAQEEYAMGSWMTGAEYERLADRYEALADRIRRGEVPFYAYERGERFFTDENVERYDLDIPDRREYAEVVAQYRSSTTGAVVSTGFVAFLALAAAIAGQFEAFMWAWGWIVFLTASLIAYIFGAYPIAGFWFFVGAVMFFSSGTFDTALTRIEEAIFNHPVGYIFIVVAFIALSLIIRRRW